MIPTGTKARSNPGRLLSAAGTAVAVALVTAGAVLPGTQAEAAGPLTVTAVGTFQSEVGCAVDWMPECASTMLSDPDGDGTYTWTTTAIPAGAWEAKVTVGGSWAENYGQNGTRDGANIPYSVPTAGTSTSFSYNSSTHRLSIQTGSGPTPTATATPTGPATAPLNTLGAIYTPARTTFRIWSPDNSNVRVEVAGASHSMTPTSLSGYSGVYQAIVEGDLLNQGYQFFVGSTKVRDPYAQMVKPGTTTGIVLNDLAVQPTGGSWAPRPALANREDSVIYELSVRDFTIDASSGVDSAKRGKYLGLVQTGTRNNGVSTGIDHLKELGVTTVHLLPTYDFSSTVPNWGYDPLNFNVPEEQYSQFTGAEDRIREFKDLVNGFHRNGIRVVLDVVYNHTTSKDVLGGITGKYYTGPDFSGVGNSLDDGQPMVSRMIRDSLEHWTRAYNIDGFRFDLMGVFHHSNVRAWGNHLTSTFADRNLVLYGEPWMGGAAPGNEADYVRYGSTAAMQDGHIGVFNGAYRDAIKGGTRDQNMAYMGGGGNVWDVQTGTRGSPRATKSTNVLPNPWDREFAYDPEQTINYVSAHDDLNLYDKITYSGAGGGANGKAGRIDKFAAGMVLTSQGIPFFTEGDEFLHSKVVNGNYEAAKNSYDSPDSVNAITWGEKSANASIFRFYKDAIALRKSTPALRLTSWDAVKNQDLTWVYGSVLMASISSNPSAPTDRDTVVVYNPTADDFTASLPSGNWRKVLDPNGATNATDTNCESLGVTVFKRS